MRVYVGVSPQEKPEDLSKDATVLETRHHALRVASYEAQVAWLENTLELLACCLDAQQELTYAQLDSLLLSVKASVYSGKDKRVREGDFACTVSFDATKSPPEAHISLLADKA